MEEQPAPTPISVVTAPPTLQSAEPSHVPAIASPSPPPSVAELSPAQEEEEAATEAATTPSTVTPTTTTTTTPTTTRSSSSVSASTQRDVEDGKHYVNRKFQCPRACKAYTPTLEELQKMGFSDYVRHVVLDGARVNPSLEGVAERMDKEDSTTEPPAAAGRSDAKTRVYSEGMAKVTLPQGFWKEEGIGQDRTGRGPAWQKGTPLGDMVIPNPIRQVVRGIGGVYEYTLLDRPPIALHAFRELADAYYDNQLSGKKMPEPPKRKKKEPVKSSREKRLQHLNEIRKAKEEKEERKDASSEEDAEQGGDSKKESKNDNKKKKEEEKKKEPPTIEELERKFWKRLGPTMPPPDYGADMEGSLFGDDPACGWNLGRLDTFLHLLGPHLPGVTSPYLYMGMWASVFAAHTEDMNLLSINYLHAGAPKIWYAVAPGPDAQRFETLCEHYFAHVARDCKQFLRHKRCLLSPMILKKAGIKFTMQVQNPGDAMITMPGGYHFGFNSGFNVAEATNFGVPEWIPFGHEAKICMCRPDSVRIDMIRLERLQARYIKENKRKTSRRRKSFRDWGILHAKAHMKSKEDSDSETESEDEEGGNKTGSNNQKVATKPPKKPRMKEFWVEVMAAVPSSQRADYGTRVSTVSQPSKKVTPKKRPRGKVKQRQEPEEEKECWHLAKPMTRKGLVLNAKVLVFIPGALNLDQAQDSDSSDSNSSSDEEEDEQCFAGVITEFTEEHCRVHFDRLPKDDDVWMHIESHKLFLDGGKWEALESKQKLPAKHYWKEQDSKRRCV